MINENYAGPRIAVIGGGTGLSVILRGMKRITDQLTAIVTVADDGGGSGVLREDLGMLPPGDIRSCILAMADEEGLMLELLKYRFTEGMLEGQSFGNLLIAALNGICGNFEEAVAKTHEILRVRGQVLPVTGTDIRLGAKLENGALVFGESQIQPEVLRQGSPIQKVFLIPENPTATKGAIEAIHNADILVMGPGSLFTSIIPNFLVEGVADAIRQASGRKILICNMMTQPGETDHFTVWDHVEKASRYLGDGVIEYVIANNTVIDEETLKPYSEDGAEQIIPTAEDRFRLKEFGISLIENNFAEVKKGYIRHDADRIASVLYSLLSD
ncbi:YvcK family protein [Anoxybacterium hadale]|uniref:YvcK family protein n=1 Tax=Anoxybacterium hadale TaxID=3408580 RepID=A0ACD1AH49_9FIRM|nr:YvcK family protein [Clostridiales bacterium]